MTPRALRAVSVRASVVMKRERLTSISLVASVRAGTVAMGEGMGPV